MGIHKFPRKKPDIVALAQAMINGFTVDTTDFPEPPIKPDALQTTLDAALAKRNARITAEAALAEAVVDENEAFDDLADDMKTDLQYAEMMTKGDDAKLKEIGWAGRAAPTPLQIPGVPRTFEIIEQGKGWAKFDWKSPDSGGKVSMYRVLRMEVGGSAGDWTEVASAVKLEATVTGQANGKDYLFCVVAVNSAGAGGQSNAVTAFL